MPYSKRGYEFIRKIKQVTSIIFYYFGQFWCINSQLFFSSVLYNKFLDSSKFNNSEEIDKDKAVQQK